MLLTSTTAFAGEHSERLSKCFMASTTEEDKTALVRWIFGAISRYPEVSDIANLSPQTWDEITKSSAHVLQKLIADKCASESRDAILNEGMSGYKSAFETLGSTAVGGLMSDPAVVKAFADLETHMSEEKIMKALMTGTSQGE